MPREPNPFSLSTFLEASVNLAMHVNNKVYGVCPETLMLFTQNRLV
jgi:hypothetical protein